MSKLNIKFFSLELIIIIIYVYISIFSISIQPINLILGIICVLFLPGYNLMEVIKPDSSLFEKLGYMTLLSLAIENILMFFSYIAVFKDYIYDEKYSTKLGFQFNSTLLIIEFQIINLIIIIINQYKRYKSKNNIISISGAENSHFNVKRGIIDFKIIYIFIIFVLSLILTCVSTFYSNAPKKGFYINYRDYRESLTFFLRVPYIFYIFIILAILCLTIIIFYSKSHFLILISISLFIYVLWILPYIQIGDYFSYDSRYLNYLYRDYLFAGIKSAGKYGLCVLVRYGSQRYSTHLFTAIIMTSATNFDITFVIWWLFPVIYVFTPFFFYSIFQQVSDKNEKTNNSRELIVLTVFATIIPQIIKGGHNGSTGLMGILLFFMIIVEFYKVMHLAAKKLINILFIVFLYFFLCLTHFEENIYFLLLVPLYTFYYLFSKIKKNLFQNWSDQKLSDQYNKESFVISLEANKNISTHNLKIDLIINGILTCLLAVIFLSLTEFFGYTYHYYFMIFSWIPSLYSFFGFSFYIATNSIVLIVLGSTIFFSICYLLIFKYYNILIKIYNVGIFIFKRIFNATKKLISKKAFQIIFFALSYFIIIILDLSYSIAIKGNFFVFLFSNILAYAYTIFQFLLFLKGFKYYKIENDKQNYFLLATVSSSALLIFYALMSFSFVPHYAWMAIYLFHDKFVAYLIFFNLIIIQDTIIKNCAENKSKFLPYLIFLFLLLEIFYCLRDLRYG